MAKGKGSSFEREVCRSLSRWWSRGERDDIFWRSAGSGAMAKTRSKTGKDTFGQYGDVQAVDPVGQPLLDVFTIEIKRGYSGYTFADMLDKKPGAAEQTWEKALSQVLTDTKNSGSKTWMLISRRDRRECLVFLCPHILNKLIGNDYQRSNIHAYVKAKFPLKTGEVISVWGMLLESFYSAVSPENIKNIK